MVRATMIEVATSTLSLAPGGAVSYTAAVYRWTRKGGVPSCTAAVAGFVVTLFNAASLLVFGVVSAALLIGQHRLAGNEAVAVAIVSVVILATIAVAAAAVIWPSWLIVILRAARRLPLIRRASWLQRADDQVAQLKATVSTLRHGGWGRPAASAALNLAFDAATLALVFNAAGVRVGTATLLAGYGLPIMLGQASFLPGGLAVTELSMSALYISLGLRPSVVIASVVTYRLVSLWLPAVLGLPLIVYLQLRRRSQKVGETEPMNERIERR
jgi:putative heme transporter